MSSALLYVNMTRRQTGFRIPDHELKALDAYARRFEAAHPGAKMNRTDALRTIYLAALREAGINPADFVAPSTTSTDTPDAAQG